MNRRALSMLWIVLWLAACPASDDPGASADQLVPPPQDLGQQTPPRLVAIGDVHGDLATTRKALVMAGAIDAQDQWIGGKMVLVQIGDHLDRGKQDREVFDLLESLVTQAEKAGGKVHILLGNHESMNVQLDFRYITAEAFKEFDDITFNPNDPVLKALPADQRGRGEAFRPGGKYARVLAEHKAILVYKDTVFVHGGVLPSHVTFGVDKINQAISAWMKKGGTEPVQFTGSTGPMWDRTYGTDATTNDCALLKQVLTSMSVKRMVVGHQPYPSGISSACNEQIWRIDTGMSPYYGGIVQVLQIVDGKPTVITK
jgi:hypothetical protein